MLLADTLLLLSRHTLADIHDTLFPNDTPVAPLSEEQMRAEICAYWNTKAHWEDLLNALSPSERRQMTRLALQERCPIDAFLEELASLGVVMLHREQNRCELSDDVRFHLLERLPSLHDRLQATEDGEDGMAPV
ncbi:hypothetical protein OS242_19225 [Tumebacillus sp. DT12]|uniref:Uncharacterized protein n=1 Tax=Tumebacillus lacus TaxID=2995335 RepID=A0ABT3X598_9BACL|nr:hypothetical protein [Tumebacillus lacus]MCX7572073.1 hypothetical protein [Tumebacillus lacus]